MNDLFTTCWCGYEAVNARDLTQHQLYCDPHNTAPKMIDDQRKRIAELEAQLAEAQAELTRLWQLAYNGEYTKARNWGADHEQADAYAMRVAGEKK